MLHWLYEMTWGAHQPVPVSNLSNDTVFLLLVSVLGFYKKMNCTEKGCPWPGRHPVAGTKYRTCHHHATATVHDRLWADHARKHPEQHELLNRNPTNEGVSQ